MPRARCSVMLVVASLGLIACENVGNAAQEAITCGLTEVASSSSTAQFTQIRSLSADSRGHIYVLESWPSPRIAVLSPNGALVRMIGRAGEGPGEFRDPVNIQILRDDSLLVFDQGLNRITVFAPGSGEVAYTTNLTSLLSPPFWVEQSEKGLLLGQFRQYYSASDNPADDVDRRQVLRLLDPEGSLLRDSVLTFPEPQSHVVVREGPFVSAAPNPLGRLGALALGPGDRIYYGRGDSLAIEIYSLSGQQLGGFAAPHKPVPVTERDVAGAFDPISEEDFYTALREAAPETWPAFQNFVVDDQGRVWVGIITPAGQPTDWMVFHDSGNRICSVALPKSVEIFHVRDEKAYAVATNDMDVPRVVVYRLGTPLVLASSVEE